MRPARALGAAAAALLVACGPRPDAAPPRAGPPGAPGEATGAFEPEWLPRLVTPGALPCGIPTLVSARGLLEPAAEARIRAALAARGHLEESTPPVPAAPRQGADTLKLGADTRRALASFQQQEGLPVTGLPSYQTLQRLGLALDEVLVTEADLGACPVQEEPAPSAP